MLIKFSSIPLYINEILVCTLSQVDWKENFPNRDLQAFSASPLLVYPTHYTGEVGYISDTELSPIINDAEDASPVEPGLDGKGLELDLGISGLSKDEL